MMKFVVASTDFNNNFVNYYWVFKLNDEDNNNFSHGKKINSHQGEWKVL